MTEADKGQWASRFQNEFSAGKLFGMTKFQVKKALMEVWDDDMFWFQCVERFGLLNRPLDELDRNIIEQASSNFWGMLKNGVRPK